MPIKKIARLKAWARARGWYGTTATSAKPEWPPVLTRMKALFEREQIPYRLISHAKAETASELANSIHPVRGKIAKVVIVRADRDYVMAVLPFYDQLDLIRFAQVLGVPRATLAEEREMKRLFPDCEVGAIPPLGRLYGLRVYVDAVLAREPDIFFPAGSHYEAVKIRYEDFERLVRPAVDHLTLEPLKRASGF